MVTCLSAYAVSAVKTPLFQVPLWNRRSPSPTRAVSDEKPSKTSVWEVANCETFIELDISFTVAGSVTVKVTDVLVLEPLKTLVPSIASIVLEDDEIEFREKIIKFRNDELHHKNIAYDEGASKEGPYRILDEIIKTGSKIAIKISEKY